MKEIMKEHGGLLVTVAVTICILTIIFSAVTDSDGNRGIVKIIAAHMNTDGTDYNAYTDYGAYQTEIADISIWIAEKQSKSNQIKRKPRKENYEKTGIK